MIDDHLNHVRHQQNIGDLVFGDRRHGHYRVEGGQNEFLYRRLQLIEEFNGAVKHDPSNHEAPCGRVGR